MSDLNVIKYRPDGDPDTGLQTWDALAAEIVVSGEPVQRGHTWHETAGGVFTSGVWDCTPHRLVPGPYEVDEFMIVLEGSIIIEHEDGDTRRFRAGEAFVIPRGTPCSWVQDEYALKFWAIHDDPSNPLESDPGLHAIAADPDAALDAVAGLDAAQFDGGVPEMAQRVLYRDPGGKFEAGIWECSPMRRKPATLARSELMHILEGSGSITNGDGAVFEFRAGDTFLVPIGMGYRWQNDSRVKKFYCSYTP